MADLYNTGQKFGLITKTLHWGVGLMVIALLCLGLFMEGLPATHPLKSTLYMTHKSLGVIILPFAALWIFSWLTQKKTRSITRNSTPVAATI